MSWFAVDRDIFNHPLFNEPRVFSCLEAFQWIVANAQLRDREWDGRIIPRGSLIISKTELAMVFKWSRSKLDRFFDAVKKEGLLEHQTSRKRAVIKVVNFERYQSVKFLLAKARDEETKKTRKVFEQKSVGSQKDTIYCTSTCTSTPLPPKNGGEDLDIKTPIPEKLSSAKFRESWQTFLSHRKLLKKPVTSMAASRLLKKLEGMGIDKAIIAIDDAIANGWQSVWEPRQSGINNHQPQPARGAAYTNIVRAESNGRSPTSAQAQAIINKVSKQLTLAK